MSGPAPPPAAIEAVVVVAAAKLTCEAIVAVAVLAKVVRVGASGLARGPVVKISVLLLYAETMPPLIVSELIDE